MRAFFYLFTASRSPYIASVNDPITAVDRLFCVVSFPSELIGIPLAIVTLYFTIYLHFTQSTAFVIKKG